MDVELAEHHTMLILVYRIIRSNLVAVLVLSNPALMVHPWMPSLVISNVFLTVLQEVAPDSSIYNAVIHGLCLRGKTGLANKVYAKMRSIGLVADGKTRAFMLQHIATD